MVDQRFPASRRLKKRREFLRLQRYGLRAYGRRFIFHFMVGRTPTSRIGITVSKKVGNAVVRNRVKRWVREAYRQHPELDRRTASGETPYDLVVTAKRDVDDFSFAVIRDELVHVITTYLEDPDSLRRRRGKRRSNRHR